MAQDDEGGAGMTNAELIEALRLYAEESPEAKLLNDAADAIEAMSCEVEEYKAAYRKEYNKRIAENRHLYDELTKTVRAKLLMTPMRIEVPQPPKEE